MIRVLIADDQALLRAGFRVMLDSEADIDMVGEAADGAEAVELAGRLAADVVLMDVRMPGIGGIEGTRRLLQRTGGRPRVLMLTTFDHDEYLYDALHAGASGFLLKNVSPTTSSTPVRAVAAGETQLDPAITSRLLGQFIRRPAPGSRAPSELAELTDRELDVLRLMARGLSNATIAEQKLGVRDRVQAVVLAYESGLVVPGGD